MTQPISGVPASAVTLSPLFNGQSDLQSALVSMIPYQEFKVAVETTVSATPVSYHLYAPNLEYTGRYKVDSWTVAGSDQNNTVVDVEFLVNGVGFPVTWTEQPVGGDQFVTATTFFDFAAGINTLEITFLRVSGAGAARISSNQFILTRTDTR